MIINNIKAIIDDIIKIIIKFYHFLFCIYAIEPQYSYYFPHAYSPFLGYDRQTKQKGVLHKLHSKCLQSFKCDITFEHLGQYLY